MAPRPTAVLRFIWRSAWRIAVTLVGAALMLAGVAMLVLPGPGLVVIVLGLAVLATEYVWAATALEHARATAKKGGNVARDAMRSTRDRERRTPRTPSDLP